MDDRIMQDCGEGFPVFLTTTSPLTSALPTREEALPPTFFQHHTAYLIRRSTTPSSPPVPIHISGAPVAIVLPAVTADPKATLLTRACIPLTFGRLPAEKYLAHLLGVSSQSNWDISLGSGRQTGTYRVILGVSTHTIDYDVGWVRGEGSLVPQNLWRPASDLNHTRLVSNAGLELPIWFDMSTGGVGISIADAVDGDRAGLRDKYSQVCMKNRATTMIRLLLQGQSAKQSQIHIRDDTAARAPVTRDRLVRIVGQHVEKLYKELGLLLSPGDRHFLIMLGIIHVSVGCWQPLLFKLQHATPSSTRSA